MLTNHLVENEYVILYTNVNHFLQEDIVPYGRLANFPFILFIL